LVQCGVTIGYYLRLNNSYMCSFILF
jgi:hypothetical protein